MLPKKLIFTYGTRHQHQWKHLLVALFLVAGGLFALVRPVAAQTTPGATLDFDGANDYVTLPSTLNQQSGANRITVAGWFYPTASPANAIALIGEQYTDDGNIRFVLQQGDSVVGCGFQSSWNGWTQTPVAAWNLNTWQHVACTYDQQNIKLYINGVVVATQPATAALPSSNGQWYMGRQWYYADTYKGQMDEVRIWNRALTLSEIATEMCTPGTLPSGLVAYYNFNQGTALANNSGVTTLTDSSGNNLNGTLSNFALTGSTSNWVAPGAVSQACVTSPTPEPLPYLTQWGSNGSGAGQFQYLGQPVVDSAGNVYVPDLNNHRVQKFASNGLYLTQWGSNGTGDGQFANPYGIAIDRQGYIYVSDLGNHNIQKFDSNGAFIARWGGYGTGDGQFNRPHGLAVDSANNLYVADYENHRIQKFSSSGAFLTKWGGYGSGNGQFNLVVDLAIDSQGNLYVADVLNHRIQKFTSSGVYLAQWGSLGSGNGQFDYPYDIAIDQHDNLYIDDAANARIQLFTSNGVYLTQWGSTGSGNGQFSFPTGLALNRSGTLLYVSDNNNHRVQAFGTLLPELTVQSNGVNLVNSSKINVPVTFTGNGKSIASVGFALDYQESCLAFDATDSDGNGVPDAITGLPAAFAPSISHQPSKSSGELEIALYDDSSPISTLSDGTLFTVQFTVQAACLPSTGAPTSVAINFAASPAVSFGDPTGADVTGTATGATLTLQPTAAPTALGLSNSSVAENSAISTTVGVFTTTDADSDSFTYTLVSGTGSDDNASFAITGDTLQTAAVFDYETKNSYTIRVRTTDNGGNFFEQSFTIGVTDVNETPTALALDKSSVAENSAAGSAVGAFSTTDLDSGDSFTYTLVSGTGSDDNASFTIEGNTLKTAAVFDYETKNSYTIRSRTTDRGGLFVEQNFTISVTDVTEVLTAVDDFIDPRATVFLGGQAATIDVLANDLANGGTLSVASVTQPATGGSVTNNTTNVSYTAPQANGSTTFTYQATDGATTSNDATVTVNYVANHARGDCNGNGGVSAADFIGVVLEIFDANNTQYQGKPAWWLVYTGDFAGSPLGCDANASANGSAPANPTASITAADIICSVLIFFGHECGTGLQAAGVTAASHLAVADAQASAGATTTLTVTLDTGGNEIAAATFALGLDPAVLHFATTDADEDGVPDAIILNTPAGMSKSATWNAAAKRLEVAVFGMSLPLPTLTDGTLATVAITVNQETTINTTPLALDLVSFSDTEGNDLPFTDQDGTLTIHTSNVQRPLFLPLVAR